MMLTRLLVPIWAVATFLLCSGCEDSRPVKIGDPSPEISGSDIHGRRVSLETLKGQTVVIYFWTNSCCGKNVKDLEPLYKTNRDRGLAVLAINEMDAKEDVERYAEKNGVTFTMVSDRDYEIFKRYRGSGFPTIFIVDKEGVIREKILGDIAVARLEKLIQRQLERR